jgi:UDP-3-O-[3-hydroxymyristoyl] glucosamine N-acyltransferase
MVLHQIQMEHTKIQIGNNIEDNVDIGSCTTIDRATMGSTNQKRSKIRQSNPDCSQC